MLTVEDVARRTGWCGRTARNYVAAWFTAWELHRGRLARREASTPPRYPETTLQRTGKPGRPAYGVDASGFDAWERNGTAPANDVARAHAAA